MDAPTQPGSTRLDKKDLRQRSTAPHATPPCAEPRGAPLHRAPIPTLRQPAAPPPHTSSEQPRPAGCRRKHAYHNPTNGPRPNQGNNNKRRHSRVCSAPLPTRQGCITTSTHTLTPTHMQHHQYQRAQLCCVHDPRTLLQREGAHKTAGRLGQRARHTPAHPNKGPGADPNGSPPLAAAVLPSSRTAGSAGTGPRPNHHQVLQTSAARGDASVRGQTPAPAGCCSRSCRLPALPTQQTMHGTSGPESRDTQCLGVA